MNFSAYKHVIRRNEGPAQKERSRTQARSYKMGWNQSFMSIQSYLETVLHIFTRFMFDVLSKNVLYNSVIWFTFCTFINSRNTKVPNRSTSHYEHPRFFRMLLKGNLTLIYCDLLGKSIIFCNNSPVYRFVTLRYTQSLPRAFSESGKNPHETNPHYWGHSDCLAAAIWLCFPTRSHLMYEKLSRGHLTYFRVLDQLKCSAAKLSILIGWTYEKPFKIRIFLQKII